MTVPLDEMRTDLANTKRERDWYAEGGEMFQEIAASAARPDEQRAALLQSRRCMAEVRRRDDFIDRLETLIEQRKEAGGE